MERVRLVLTAVIAVSLAVIAMDTVFPVARAAEGVGPVTCESFLIETYLQGGERKQWASQVNEDIAPVRQWLDAHPGFPVFRRDHGSVVTICVR